MNPNHELSTINLFQPALSLKTIFRAQNLLLTKYREQFISIIGLKLLERCFLAFGIFFEFVVSE